MRLPQHLLKVVTSTLLATLLFQASCQSLAPLAPRNLAEPGWLVQQGQAVWRPNRKAQEVAGELILATYPDGSSFVQFTKTPFPILLAQTTLERWEIQFQPKARTLSGKSPPPERFIWLHLAGCLGAGEKPPKNWSLNWPENKHWVFENRSTGERLEGYLKP